MYLLCCLLLLSIQLLNSPLRLKFIYFILLSVCFAIWGFIYELDGMMLILLITEFTVVLLFLMTYIQLYSVTNFITVKSKFSVILAIIPLIFILANVSQTFFVFNSFYLTISHITASDFFILYFLLFDKLPLLVIFLTLIIGLFSFFFILIYFNLKLAKVAQNKTLNSVYVLRKQNLLKQTTYKNNLYGFQN